MGSFYRAGNPPPSCLKLVRIMLETSNLVCKYTHVCSFKKYTFKDQGPLHFLSGFFFCKKSAFWGENLVPLLKAKIVRAVLKIFLFCFQFLLDKSFPDYASGIWLQNCSKLTINLGNENDVTICQHDVIVDFFDVLFPLSSQLLAQVSCQSPV